MIIFMFDLPTNETIKNGHLHLDGLKELKLIICMFIKQMFI